MEPDENIDLQDLIFIVKYFIDEDCYRNICFETNPQTDVWTCVITIENIGGMQNKKYFDEHVTDGLVSLSSLHTDGDSLDTIIKRSYRRLLAIEQAINE